MSAPTPDQPTPLQRAAELARVYRETRKKPGAPFPAELKAAMASALVRGVSLRRLARETGLGESSVRQVALAAGLRATRGTGKYHRMAIHGDPFEGLKS